MNLAPNNLDISLERKDRLGFWLFVGCVSVILISALINPLFAQYFAASCVVGLPVIWVMIFSKTIQGLFNLKLNLGAILFYLGIFGYIALAKTTLVPMVLLAIQHVLA